MHSFRLLLAVLGKAAFAATLDTALEPRDTTCSTPYGIGTCILTSSCAGTSVPNYCPGAADIECCVRTCKTPLGSGFCDDTSNACTGGAYVPNYCPGATNIQCCVASCNTGSATGNCLWTGSTCANSFVPNYCPGPNDVECCLSSVAKSATVPASSDPSTPQTVTVDDSPPPESTADPQTSKTAGDPPASGATSNPSHTGTAGNSEPSQDGASTPLGDANSSAGSPYYSDSPGNTGNPSSPTGTSKHPTTNLKTGGSGNAATDPPLSGSGSSSGPDSSEGSTALGSPKHISTGAIAGISIIGFITLAVMIGGVIWLVRKKKREGQGHKIQEISEGPLVVVGRRVGHELDGSPLHEVGQHLSREPPAYAQELYSMEIYEMRGHKQ
ncbi:hypothetical protein L207DRAFT_575963 [Hyaloscypha variabilis F]|uniref:Mid2 domain-containing protein n=1 Tax=Hyaloscypha variabilis (strain UAMH 11265 / GT02V1 / F) TaxID=1149755 RepID=A0A2J6S8T4_HYAVF|nr:hypothetical protein L207DRAFT_575963 [Hyaloscypha variabilis F]